MSVPEDVTFHIDLSLRSRPFHVKNVTELVEINLTISPFSPIVSSKSTAGFRVVRVDTRALRSSSGPLPLTFSGGADALIDTARHYPSAMQKALFDMATEQYALLAGT